MKHILSKLCNRLTKINEKIVKETQHILKVLQLIETKINANIVKETNYQSYAID